MQANPRRGNPGVQQGLIVGVALGAISIISNLITSFAHPTGAIAFLIGAVFFVIALLGYAYAGYRASAITGRVGTGAIAGLIAGLIAGIIGSIVSIILIVSGITVIANAGAVNRSVLLVGAIIGIIIGLAIALGIGAGLGAIGGLIGKSRAPQGQQYQEVLYQGMPPAQGPYQQGPYQGVPPTQNQYPQDTPYPQNPYQGTPPTQNPPPPNNYPGNYQ